MNVYLSNCADIWIIATWETVESPVILTASVLKLLIDNID